MECADGVDVAAQLNEASTFRGVEVPTYAEAVRRGIEDPAACA